MSQAIVDKAITEIFINDGELCFVKAEKLGKVHANGLKDDRKTILKKLEVNDLASVWKK
jgi:hypothetical protein